MDYDVFDIAHSLLDRSSENMMSTLKLQKLCFYTYGWYAHQTGEGLFREQFFAMEYGPVVGELLSAHAKKQRISPSDLEPQFEERETSPSELDSYVSAIVDAVIETYGHYDQWHLVRMTHQESVWTTAWDRRDKARRGDMHRQDIIDHFFHGHAVMPRRLQLPDARVTIECEDFLRDLDERGTASPSSFFDELESLLSVPDRR